MPWICPKGCHKDHLDWRVEMWETRPDLIVHYYEPDDKELKEEQGHKVYIGEVSEYTGPHCLECDTDCEWEDPNAQV